jgi:hypothetical protein
LAEIGWWTKPRPMRKCDLAKCGKEFRPLAKNHRFCCEAHRREAQKVNSKNLRRMG